MRILVASHVLPWPVDSGGSAAQFAAFKCLASDHEFTLVVPVWSKEEIGHAKLLEARIPNLRVRAVHCKPNAARRLSWRLLGELKYKIKSLIRKKKALDKMADPFYELPAPFVAALNDEFTHRRPDLVQIEFAEVLSLGPWLPQNIPRVFIHHQIHFVYCQRYIETHGSSPVSEYRSKRMKYLEMAFLGSYDKVVTLSDTDRDVLLREEPKMDVDTCPFPFPSDFDVPSALPSQFSGKFLFIGSQAHDPNRDALKWLLEKIWPSIRAACPGARLIVSGAWSEEWRKVHTTDRVVYSGFVRDLSELLAGGVMLVPVRIGSGLRTKILLALSQGVPVVSTRVGAEGIIAENNVDIMIEDSPEHFAQSAIRLSQDSVLWRQLAANGLAIANTHYSPESVRRKRNAIYEAAAAKYAAPRR